MSLSTTFQMVAIAVCVLEKIFIKVEKYLNNLNRIAQLQLIDLTLKVRHSK